MACLATGYVRATLLINIHSHDDPRHHNDIGFAVPNTGLAALRYR
jgi:hypothetical protein